MNGPVPFFIVLTWSVLIPNSDESIEKKRASRGDSRRATERLRQLDVEIEEASLRLRQAKATEEFVERKLRALESKHSALLSLYDTESSALQDVFESPTEEAAAVTTAAGDANNAKQTDEDDNEGGNVTSEDAVRADSASTNNEQEPIAGARDVTESKPTGSDGADTGTKTS